MKTPENRLSSEKVKEAAKRAGFDQCGIARAGFLEEENSHFLQWLSEKKQGTISYLEKNIEQKTNPKVISPNIKSVITAIISYFPEGTQNKHSHYKFSKYACARDYHLVLKEKLRFLTDELKAHYPDATFQSFFDSNQLLEKAWAIESGLGWRGKNSLLINKTFGSFVFIGIILTDIDLQHDEVQKNLCGNCTKCIDACPVQAIEKPYELNASKCISNFLIEQKNEKQAKRKNTFGWIYGCDICQDVCPRNKKIPYTKIPEFSPDPDLMKMKKEDWQNLDEVKFNSLFKNSAVKRAGFEKLKRNIENASNEY